MSKKKATNRKRGAVIRSTVGLADSPTWPYVLAFAKRMEAKLAKNRHKGDRDGWIKYNPRDLLARLDEETTELDAALFAVARKDNIVAREREQIINEAADVANFAMMIADIYGMSANAEVSRSRPTASMDDTKNI